MRRAVYALLCLAWAAVCAAVLLWPAPIDTPLGGAPLESRWAAILIGLTLPLLWCLQPAFLRTRPAIVIIVLIGAWKTATTATTVRDGWCLRVDALHPITLAGTRVPHAWDVRADWRTLVPACSAIMTRGYARIEEFPIWFFNLPPASDQPPGAFDRPPGARVAMTIDGFFVAPSDGSFGVRVGPGMRVRGTVDGVPLADSETALGPLALRAGPHEVRMAGELTGERWRLEPRWNGDAADRRTIMTLARPSQADVWLRRYLRHTTTALAAILVGLWLIAVVAHVRSTSALAWTACASSLAFLVGAIAPAAGARWAALALSGAIVIPLPARLRNTTGVLLTIGTPWMMLAAARGLPVIGTTTLYTPGDDFWMFQRYAYRIFMEGFWLEGGQPTFWFQPLYRWIAGALHMIFGDGSVGELYWDAGCMLVAALFAFRVCRSVVGFRWGAGAAVLVLVVYTLGPGFYLLGRGLSEITSAAFVYAAALHAMPARRGPLAGLAVAGLFAVLGFYTRLNNLIFAAGVAAFAWPLRRSVWSDEPLTSRASLRVLVGIPALLAAGLLLFALRTWYYTGHLDVLYGTQRYALGVWRPTDSFARNARASLESLLMIVTMADPPRFDSRAFPLMAGTAAVALAVLRVRPFRTLSLPLVLFTGAALAGALVARGVSYPGRFSIHFVPVATAVAVCSTATVLSSTVSRRKHDHAEPV